MLFYFFLKVQLKDIDIKTTASWIHPDDVIELYGFPSLSRWGIHTMKELLIFHLHEYSTLGIPKPILKRVVFLLEKQGLKI